MLAFTCMSEAREATEAPADEERTPLSGMVIVIALGALLGLLVLPRLSPARAGVSADMELAPDFTLPVAANGETGARMQLADLRDKVVILDFWATWCGPCRMQAPILDRVARRHADDVVVLGINVGESPGLAQRYAQQEGLSYPILADVNGEAQELYEANTLPTVVVIDREGKVRSLVHGVMRESAVEKAIRNL